MTLYGGIGMSIRAILAQLNCSELEMSTVWYCKLFAREPDSRPMNHLSEWHHGDSAGLQLFENAEHAGHGTLTLVVDDVQREHLRLSEVGLMPGDVEPGKFSLIRLNDPDGNLVVLAQPTSD